MTTLRLPHMTRFAVATVFVALAGCDSSPKIAGLGTASCRAVATIAPASASIHVADSIRFASSVESGCPAPLLRNDTPTIIRLDGISGSTFRVTGLAVGTGHVRVLSALDTTVAADAAITVTP